MWIWLHHMQFKQCASMLKIKFTSVYHFTRASLFILTSFRVVKRFHFFIAFNEFSIAKVIFMSIFTGSACQLLKRFLQADVWKNFDLCALQLHQPIRVNSNKFMVFKHESLVSYDACSLIDLIFRRILMNEIEFMLFLLHLKSCWSQSDCFDPRNFEHQLKFSFRSF